jgi:hypothetical protein
MTVDDFVQTDESDVAAIHSQSIGVVMDTKGIKIV